MKKFKVYLTNSFLKDLSRVFEFIKISSPQNAKMVVDNIKKSIMTLANTPEAHPKAYEAASFENLNLRQLICKNHRIIYLIKRQNVYVLSLLNCKQELISRDKLEQILSLRVKNIFDEI